VGLTKETAHQLGTPISSLVAWQELLSAHYPEDKYLPQMNMDIQRLQMITERFSKVGSLPVLECQPMHLLVKSTIDYLRPRISSKVVINYHVEDGVENASCLLCSSLFAWVIENLIKNAVDAMDGIGTITMELHAEEDKVILDVSDTGRGIERYKFYSIFQPGYTEKKRVWGLGLSLSKRIVEDYHRGKIFVKCSGVGIGTTFRIIVKKAEDGGPTA